MLAAILQGDCAQAFNGCKSVLFATILHFYFTLRA